MLEVRDNLIVNDEGTKSFLDVDINPVEGRHSDVCDLQAGATYILGIRLKVWAFFAVKLSSEYDIMRIPKNKRDGKKHFSKNIFQLEGEQERATAGRDPSRRYRILEVPPPQLKQAQRVLLDAIYNRIPMDPHAVGFRENYGIMDAVKNHEGKKIIFKMDLKNFFPSITFDMISEAQRAQYLPRWLLENFSQSESWANAFISPSQTAEETLAKFYNLLPNLVTYKGHLPTGSPTSPAVANMVFKQMDEKIANYCQEWGLEYTRYADDLVFSTDTEYPEEQVHTLVRHLIDMIEDGASYLKGGIKVNKEKVVIYYGKAHEQKKVLGVVLNKIANITRYERHQVRAMLHNIEVNGFEAEAGKFGSYSVHRFYKHWLGVLNWWSQVNPEKHKPVLERFKELWKNDKSAKQTVKYEMGLLNAAHNEEMEAGGVHN
jgi:hypothetical protein